MVNAVLAEVERAGALYPQWPTDPLHAWSIVAEEHGETTRAVLQAVYEPRKSGPGDVRTEAIQTAAMAIQFLRSMPRYEWTPGAQHDRAEAGRWSAEVETPQAAPVVVDEAMVDEAEHLRDLCGHAYQMAGALDAPENWLDALSAAANGKPFSCDGLLPVLTPMPVLSWDELSGWVNDGDTIPASLIEACRQAIRREFGNDGTDGYYKRILVEVFRSVAAALGREGGGNG